MSKPKTQKPEQPKTKDKPETRGLECYKCGCRHFEVLETRPALGNRLRRRRECRNCGHRVTTYESA